MSMICKYNCGNQVDVGFYEFDSCRDIHTDDVYNIILMNKGTLTLQINNHQVKSFVPCIWALKSGGCGQKFGLPKGSERSYQYEFTRQDQHCITGKPSMQICNRNHP